MEAHWVESLLKEFLQHVKAAAHSNENRFFPHCHSDVRVYPVWYREGLPQVRKQFSDVIGVLKYRSLFTSADRRDWPHSIDFAFCPWSLDLGFERFLHLKSFLSEYKINIFQIMYFLCKIISERSFLFIYCFEDLQVDENRMLRPNRCCTSVQSHLFIGNSLSHFLEMNLANTIHVKHIFKTCWGILLFIKSRIPWRNVMVFNNTTQSKYAHQGQGRLLDTKSPITVKRFFANSMYIKHCLEWKIRSVAPPPKWTCHPTEWLRYGKNRRRKKPVPSNI